MKTIYVKQDVFDKIKTVKSYPNPKIKDGYYNNELASLHVADIITVEKLTSEECLWYNVPEGGYMLNDNIGWFPTELIADVNPITHRFDLSKGLFLSGNMGSANIGISKEYLNEALEILKQNNFTIKYN